MSKKSKGGLTGDVLQEYDFRNGERGKYSSRVNKDSAVYLRTESESRKFHGKPAKNSSTRKPVKRSAAAKSKPGRRSVSA